MMHHIENAPVPLTTPRQTTLTIAE